MERRETFRPHLHFTPKTDWMNDPNGLVYFDGEYHLFYQYRTPRHWGHAVSRDLMTWEELDVALSPDELGDIFSGSAVVDTKNTSGLFDEGKGGLIAIYTNHLSTPSGPFPYEEVQSIAFSTDKGRQWTRYKGNPVLKSEDTCDFRDPMVMWHEATSRWVMILATKRSVSFFTSSDLKEWSFASELEVTEGDDELISECPDLFECEIEGRPGERRWVLWLSWFNHQEQGLRPEGEKYYIGDFDGVTFRPEGKSRILSFGDVYATVTWKGDIERKIGIGWMNHWGYASLFPTHPWQGSMTVPREFRLREVEGELCLVQLPVKELEKKRVSSRSLSETTLGELFEAESSEAFEFTGTISVGSAQTITMELLRDDGSAFSITLHVNKRTLTLDRSRSGLTDFHPHFGDPLSIPVSLRGGALRFKLIVDAGSVEVFADDGEAYGARTLFSTGAPRGISIKAEGTAILKDAQIQRYR